MLPVCEENQTIEQMSHFSADCRGNSWFCFACHCCPLNDTVFHRNTGSENQFHSTPDLCLWRLQGKQMCDLLPTYLVPNPADTKETRVRYPSCIKGSYFFLLLRESMHPSKKKKKFYTLCTQKVFLDTENAKTKVQFNVPYPIKNVNFNLQANTFGRLDKY